MKSNRCECGSKKPSTESMCLRCSHQNGEVVPTSIIGIDMAQDKDVSAEVIAEVSEGVLTIKNIVKESPVKAIKPKPKRTTKPKKKKVNK